MKRSSCLGLLLSAACLLSAERFASAAAINIDLEGYRTGGGGTDTLVPPTTYVGVGAAGGGTVFNGLSPTALSDNTSSSVTGDNQTYSSVGGLQDSNGTATPVNFTIGPIGVDNENTNVGVPTDPQALFNDYMFNHSAGNSTNASFTISGLTPDIHYDVFLYAGFANASFLANTSITGGTLTSFAPTGIFSSTNTQLYVGVSDGSGNINGIMGAGTQILAGLSVSPVPEPNSIVLFGLGAAGLFAVGRRGRHAKTGNGTMGQKEERDGE